VPVSAFGTFLKGHLRWNAASLGDRDASWA
jgi:hypothetical protein